MAHLTTEEYLNRENIEAYFEQLALEIKTAGIGKHKILIVGGAAMVLKYSDGRSTVDIDICIREQNNLYECCRKIAEKNDLPDDWINANVMHSDSFSYGLFQDAMPYRNYDDALEVYLVSDLDLYCMKLISFRPKDIQDMDILAETLREAGLGKKDIKDRFVRLYGSAYLMHDDVRKEAFINAQFE